MYQSYPQDRIDTQVICRFAVAQKECSIVTVLLKSYKQNITSLSLMDGRTVAQFENIEGNINKVL